MIPYFVAFLGVLLTAVLIGWLHRSQQHSRQDIVDRTAPLPVLDQNPVQQPVKTSAPKPQTDPVLLETAGPVPVQQTISPIKSRPDSADRATPGEPRTSASPDEPQESPAENWLEQVRSLRESGDTEAALALAGEHFPRAQALQQAAVIRRQQLRFAIENRQPVEHLLGELYDLALMADLYRSTNTLKPAQMPDFATMPTTPKQRYHQLGHALLKLLNKSDVRALEQLWGDPVAHQHAEYLIHP